MSEIIPMTGFAERKYIARFYASNTDIGTIAGSAVQVATDGSVTFPDVKIVNDKYFFRGFRQSGRDPLLLEQAGGMINLIEDRDYVAAFGVKGSEVPYRVQYLLNGTTTKLAEDRVFYALVGDKPISSYIYIDGYQPYRRTTKTIVGDPAQDILYVYYTRIAAATGGGTTTTTTTGGGGGVAFAGGAAANANANANAANNANANNPNANNAANNTANNPAGNTPANGTQPVNPATPAPAPTQQYTEYEDILDLDVPLAAPNIPGVGTVSVPNAPQVIEPNQHGRLPNWALIAGMVVLVGLIAMLYWYLLFYRKKKKYASIGEDFEILGYEDDDF